MKSVESKTNNLIAYLFWEFSYNLLSNQWMYIVFQLVAVFAFLALASCAPQYGPQVAVGDSKNAQILRYDFDNIEVDGYNYG